MRLEDRTAVVVGVGSTIGRECALTFAREGAKVLAVDPDEAVAAEVSDAITATGGSSRSVAADFTSDESAARVAQVCEELWQRVDALVNCSAAMDWWNVEDDTVSNWEEIIRTNLLSPVVYTKWLRPLLKRSGSGSIVYLSSIDGIHGNPNLPAFSASKGALIPLTHAMAYVCAADGIRVNCIASAAIVQTGTGARQSNRQHSDEELLLRLTPMGRRATPADVAGVALFFVSRDSAYVTGVVLPVDGGRIAITPGTGL